MNERIKQLAGQALDQVVPYTWTRLDYDEIQRLQEYFARSIVKECALLCISRPGPGDDLRSREHCSEQIKQHFGVEE